MQALKVFCVRCFHDIMNVFRFNVVIPEMFWV